MSTNKNNSDSGFKSILCLFLITAIVSLLLSYINQVTEPIIKDNLKKEQDKIRMEVLDYANSFSSVKLTDDLKSRTGVTEAYKSDNNDGYVIEASSKGYGGMVSVMIGFNSDNSIYKIKILDNEETPGIGKKVQEDEFTSLFKGVNSSSISDIKIISGATMSSTAVIQAVTGAINALVSLTGGIS